MKNTRNLLTHQKKKKEEKKNTHKKNIGNKFCLLLFDIPSSNFQATPTKHDYILT